MVVMVVIIGMVSVPRVMVMIVVVVVRVPVCHMRMMGRHMNMLRVDRLRMVLCCGGRAHGRGRVCQEHGETYAHHCDDGSGDNEAPKPQRRNETPRNSSHVNSPLRLSFESLCQDEPRLVPAGAVRPSDADKPFFMLDALSGKDFRK